jgi:hypothetical protein
MFTLTTPITGLAQTGFTAPTYTIQQDTAPVVNGKQYAVTALGGTQAGVTTHSVSSPFTLSIFRPVQPKSLPPANPITGVIKNVPINKYKVIGRKGALPAANQAPQTVMAKLELDIPAGCDSFSAAEIRGLLSAMLGALAQQPAGLGDTCINGIL